MIASFRGERGHRCLLPCHTGVALLPIPQARQFPLLLRVREPSGLDRVFRSDGPRNAMFECGRQACGRGRQSATWFVQEAKIPEMNQDNLTGH